MAKYTGKQSVLDEVLGDFKDYGFSLVEIDDHLLELWFKDKRIAVYSQIAFLVNTTNPAYIAKKLQQDFQDTYGEELGHYA